MFNRERLLDRFVRYAKIDTQSDASSSTSPSTKKQWVLLNALVKDLVEAGLKDAAVDENGYVMATLPTNIPTKHSAFRKTPTIGLLAHVDTYPETSGTDVRPQLHHNYDGKDLVLAEDASIAIHATDEPKLAACLGMTIITSNGTTLLGADDKAGIAEIIEVLWRLAENPSRLHGPIRVAFTPDEEIGRGSDHFDVKKFGAAFAYTVDGSGVGEVEDETFCADSVEVTMLGSDIHPGYAKGKLINAIKVSSDFISNLPKELTPEKTSGRDGFIHPIEITGNVSRINAKFLVRDFSEKGLKTLETILETTAHATKLRYPDSHIEIDIVSSYRNMRQVIDDHQELVDYAEEAIRRTGLIPKRAAVRGGTDGAKLSFMGLPTPNLSNGSMNFHSKKEWIPLEWMEKSVETILHLLDVWVEQSTISGTEAEMDYERGESSNATSLRILDRKNHS